MGVLNQILLDGKDSRLYQELVQERALTGDVNGGINMLGNMYNYDGPMLWTAFLFHDRGTSADSVIAAIDEVVERVRTTPVDQATLDRALVKVRSDFYEDIEGFVGFGRADLLASFALFDDDPSRINGIEEQFRQVTPALLLRTAQEYLRPTNRTILLVEPEAAAAPQVTP
jgi:predicted Zn-dependent peptidase